MKKSDNVQNLKDIKRKYYIIYITLNILIYSAWLFVRPVPFWEIFAFSIVMILPFWKFYRWEISVNKK